MLVDHLYVLFGEGSIQVLFPCKNLGCLQGLAAPPGPSQVLQTVLLAALVSVSPACGAEGGGSSGTRASLAALQGQSFLPGACRRGDSRPEAPSAAPRGRGLCEAAFAHLGTAATPACLSRKWASVRSAPGWAHWLRFTWALQGRPRAASGCGRLGRGPLAWVRIGGHLARLLPAPRCGSLEPACGGWERPFSWAPGSQSASLRGAEGSGPQVRGLGLRGGGWKELRAPSLLAESRSPQTSRSREGLAFWIKALRTFPSLPNSIKLNLTWFSQAA